MEYFIGVPGYNSLARIWSCSIIPSTDGAVQHRKAMILTIIRTRQPKNERKGLMKASWFYCQPNLWKLRKLVHILTSNSRKYYLALAHRVN
jgi:hypothetical protein